MNAHILYNWFQLQDAKKPLTENQFRDTLILKIISAYGTERHHQVSNEQKLSSFKICHGSKVFRLEEKASCVYCHLHNTRSVTMQMSRLPPLVPPALCQTVEKIVTQNGTMILLQ